MTIKYPSDIDNLLSLPKVVDNVSPVRAADHNTLVDATLSIENELGIEPSGTFGTVKDRMDALEASISGNIVDGYNVGTAGVGVFKQKDGNILQFFNVNAGSSKISVSLDSPNNEISVDLIEAELTLNNLGGVLSLGKGGTGQTTAAAGFDALAPTTTKGDLIVRDSSTNTRLPVQIDGYVLLTDSAETTGIKWVPPSELGVVSGSGAATQVTFWTDTNVLAGDTSLSWDNSAKQLGVGTDTPATTVHAQKDQNTSTTLRIQNATSGSAAAAQLELTTDVGAGLGLQALSSGYSSSGLAIANSGRLKTTTALTGGLVIATEAAAPIILGTNSSEQARLTSIGNLGLGTDSPTRKLTVAGAGAQGDTTAPALMLSNSTSGRYAVIDADNSLNLNIWNSDNGVTGAIRFLTSTGTEVARLSTSGEFGVGTIAPQVKLHGSVADASIPAVVALENTDLTNNNGAKLSFITSTSGAGASNFVDMADVSAIFVQHDHGSRTAELGFNTSFGGAPTEKLRITGAGNLGVGTTTPQAKIHAVVNTFTVSTMLILENAASTNNSGAKISFRTTTTNGGGPEAELASIQTTFIEHDNTIKSSEMRFVTTTAGSLSERIRIASNGNIGIGTGTPDVLLHVRSNSSGSPIPTIKLDLNQTAWSSAEVLGRVDFAGNDSSANASGVRARMEAISPVSGGTAGATDLAFFTTATGSTTLNEVLRLTNVGQIGVGTSVPNYQVQLVGTGQLTAALTDAGDTNGLINLTGNSNSAGAGGAVAFSALLDNSTSIPFAAIKGLLTNGHTNGAGDLAFATRAAVTDIVLTERMRLTAAGQLGIGSAAPASTLTVNNGSTASDVFTIQENGTQILNLQDNIVPPDGPGFSIVSKDGAGNASWQFAGAPSIAHYFSDDFVSTPAEPEYAIFPSGFGPTIITAADAKSYDTGGSFVFGVIGISGGQVIQLQAPVVQGDGAVVVLEFRIMSTSVSGVVIANPVLEIGLTSQILSSLSSPPHAFAGDGTPPADSRSGIWISNKINTGAVDFHVAASGTIDTNSTAALLVANTWAKFKIVCAATRVVGSTIRLYKDDVLASTITVANTGFGSHVPLSTAPMYLTIQATGTSGLVHYVDYISLYKARAR